MHEPITATQLNQITEKVGRTQLGSRSTEAHCARRMGIHLFRESWKLSKFCSTVLAVNSFTWVVSFTRIALIVAYCRSWYGERLVRSRVKIEFVSALAAEP